ncbi:MAG: ABC transporter ATP-binding protein [bacterium]|nr:ABC transporter ATP-binding protein [bacterium]
MEQPLETGSEACRSTTAGAETIPDTEQTAVQTGLSLITVRNAKKIYRVGSVDIQALRGVDLTIEAGELCCIIGRSGSGKSTLLNVLAGLEHVTSGELIIAGKRLDRMNQSELIRFRQQHIGFIFQSFNLMPYYTALENVAFPLAFRGVPAYKRNRMAANMLKLVGLETHMKHKPSQMSGGQQQRVGIARALVTDPEIVFADEPTGNLDSGTSDEVMHVICDILREKGKTLIMVTHDPNMAEYADKVVNLLDGRIVDIRMQKAREQKRSPHNPLDQEKQGENQNA